MNGFVGCHKQKLKQLDNALFNIIISTLQVDTRKYDTQSEFVIKRSSRRRKETRTITVKKN